MTKEAGLKKYSLDGFLPQADMQYIDQIRGQELQKYKELLFNAERDGFSDQLEYIGDMPFRASKEVKSSRLGVGFEVLDHREAYDFDQTLKFMRNSGVKWARLQSGWQRAEQTPGVYDFKWLDHIIDSLLEAGITPWVSLSFGNGLYMDVPPCRGSYFYSPTVFGEKGINGWKNYCQAMARHFQGRVSHYEVWNEPNAGFLQKPGSELSGKIIAEPPEEYVKLVKITSEALHEVLNDVKVIGGSISGCSLCNEYIQGLFDAGIAEHIDIFSYHPYELIPELYWPSRLQFIRDRIAESGRKIEIWQGENGISVNGREVNQARFLTRRYLTDLRLGVDMTSFFTACDFRNGYNSSGIFDMGVIDASDPDCYKPKQALRAMQSFTWLFDEETSPVNVSFEIHPYETPWAYTTRPVDDLYPVVCGFRKGDIPIYAYYHPSHILSSYEVRAVSIQMYPERWSTFEKPVLIDPITARIYRIKNETTCIDGNYGRFRQFHRMPMLDYPLFLTDAAIFRDGLENFKYAQTENKE